MYATSDPTVLGSPGGRRIVLHNNYTGASEVMTRLGLESPPVATEPFDMEPGGISADGQRLVFVAPADSAIAPVPPGTTGRQAYLYDRSHGLDHVHRCRARQHRPRTARRARSRSPTTAAFVAFSSTADNLTPNADGPFADAYVYTVATGEIRLASRAYDPGPGQEPYRHTQVAISGDGQFVAYTRSDADETTSQVFRRDMVNGSVQQASVNASGLSAGASVTEPVHHRQRSVRLLHDAGDEHRPAGAGQRGLRARHGRPDDAVRAGVRANGISPARGRASAAGSGS